MTKILHILLTLVLLLLGAAAPLHAQTVKGKIYGGGEIAIVMGDAKVEVNSGTVGEMTTAGGVTTCSGGVFGGGLGHTTLVTGNVEVLIGKTGTDPDATGATIYGDVYGGSALGNVNCTATEDPSNPSHILLTATDGATTSVAINAGTVRGSMYGGALGQRKDVNGATEDIEANVYGPVLVSANGGRVKSTAVKANSGSIFGGNNLNGSPLSTITVNINASANDADAIHNVYGGGNMASYVSPITDPCPTVTVNGGHIAQDTFGGGLSADVTGNTLVSILGGAVHRNVYGGGALANVDGNTQVDLFGGAVGGAYGGALGQAAGAGKEAIAAIVTGNTQVTLGKEQTDHSYTASQVTGDGIFGANNINGTPRGHVFVHVLKTVPRSTNSGSNPRNVPNVPDSYDVPAVYGGGNLSAYEPTDSEEQTEVLIENCDNSIAYVYGGGNAAPVPATKVTIYGADAIDHAFAGGNGAGQSTDPSAPNYNPGADVGYLDYFSLGTASIYGSGKAFIDVYGGAVHNVYGGSNTLGYIRSGVTVTVEEPEDDYEGTRCELDLGDVFGGGNEAPLNCGITLNLGCSEGAELLFAGANDADVNGDITLNITSGTFGQVFCGNNMGGNIKGNLTLNVDETGCWPVMISELYACGNMAPYSVYGYNADGTCKTSGDRQYNDPVVNLVSFTRIGTVFGGGFGPTADLYGDSDVRVNPIKGKFAGQTPNPVFILDAHDKRVHNGTTTTAAYGIRHNGDGTITIPDTVGSIGSIYGGGNEGVVHGDTRVNIGLDDTNSHITGPDTTTTEDVSVTITGNVFGGGNKANVTGNTNVTVGSN